MLRDMAWSSGSSFVAFLPPFSRVLLWRRCFLQIQDEEREGEAKGCFCLNWCKVKGNQGDAMVLVLGHPQTETRDAFWVGGIMCEASWLLSVCVSLSIICFYHIYLIYLSISISCLPITHLYSYINHLFCASVSHLLPIIWLELSSISYLSLLF